MKVMDINLARTFLEVLASGSFGIAAERLHLTQTAVSARIRALEEQLGRRLFVRNKAGARLTPAGERFVHHAVTLIQVWERARYQVALPPGREDVVSLGGELTLGIRCWPTGSSGCIRNVLSLRCGRKLTVRHACSTACRRVRSILLFSTARSSDRTLSPN
jgi:hypothetical protein